MLYSPLDLTNLYYKILTKFFVKNLFLDINLPIKNICYILCIGLRDQSLTISHLMEI